VTSQGTNANDLPDFPALGPKITSPHRGCCAQRPLVACLPLSNVQSRNIRPSLPSFVRLYNIISCIPRVMIGDKEEIMQARTNHLIRIPHQQVHTVKVTRGELGPRNTGKPIPYKAELEFDWVIGRDKNQDSFKLGRAGSEAAAVSTTPPFIQSYTRCSNGQCRKLSADRENTRKPKKK